MSDKVITLDNLMSNNEEIKKYIKNQGTGLTTEDVQDMINESNNGIKISVDSTYEPLEMEE